MGILVSFRPVSRRICRNQFLQDLQNGADLVLMGSIIYEATIAVYSVRKRRIVELGEMYN